MAALVFGLQEFGQTHEVQHEAPLLPDPLSYLKQKVSSKRFAKYHSMVKYPEEDHRRSWCRWIARKRNVAQRKVIFESVYWPIKDALQSLWCFLLQGVEKVDGERHFIASRHDLLMLSRFRRSQQQALAVAKG